MANLGLEITSGLFATTSGIAHILDTADAYASGKLLSLRNNAVEKASVDFEGSFSGHDGFFGGKATIAETLRINGITADRGGSSIASNTAFGASALAANTIGIANVAIGQFALRATTTGSNNVAVGTAALFGNIGGEKNTACGSGTLFANTSGAFNVAVGYNSLLASTTGLNNVAVGSPALVKNTTGSNNVAIGPNALQENTTGSQCIAIGRDALKSSLAEDTNIAIGPGSLTTATTVQFSVAIGHAALASATSGSLNTAVGWQAFVFLTTGHSNTGVGLGVAASLTTGFQNTALGKRAFNFNTTGDSNVAVGFQALIQNETGSRNIALGAFAGSNALGSDELYIDVFDRGSAVNDKIGAILYGQMFTTVIDQILTVNAKLIVAQDVEVTGTITAAGLVGPLTGNADTVTVVDESSDTTCFPAFFISASGSLEPKTDTSNLTYNSSTGAFSATSFVGALTGNADTATLASTVVVVDTEAASTFVGLFSSASGSLACLTDEQLTYVANTGILTAAGFVGDLTGNVTGNVSGSSGSTTGNASTATALATPRNIGGVAFDGTAAIVPQTIQVVDSTDASSSIAMFDSATGSLQPKTDAGLAYNATTGLLTATGFAGPLTGAVTGNADSATVLATPRDINSVAFDGSQNITITAAAGTLTGTVLNGTVVSSSLTSLGTITSLVATSVDLNGGTIDGTVIGGSVAAAGSFTTLDASGNLTVVGTTLLTGDLTQTKAGNVLWTMEDTTTGVGGSTRNLSTLSIVGASTTDVLRTFCQIGFFSSTAANTAESGRIIFRNIVSGTLTDVLTISAENTSFAGTFDVSGLITATAGIKLGTTVTLTEGSANRLDLASGDDFYIVSGAMGIGAVPSANADLLLESGRLMLRESATPTADTNYGKIYTKDTNKLFFQDGAGAEHEVAFV